MKKIMDISNFFKLIRRVDELSVQDLAIRLSMSVERIKNIESGLDGITQEEFKRVKTYAPLNINGVFGTINKGGGN